MLKKALQCGAARYIRTFHDIFEVIHVLLRSGGGCAISEILDYRMLFFLGPVNWNISKDISIALLIMI